jgi:hypothetical protein
VLGIEPDGTGLEKYRIAPKTGDLTWARGGLPSARGDIRVAWLDTAAARRKTLQHAAPPTDLFNSMKPGHPLVGRSNESRIVLEVVLPDDLPAELVVPIPEAGVTRVLHNGQAVEIEERGEEDAVMLSVPGGTHQVAIHVK